MDVRRVIEAALREVDTTATLAECVAEPDGPGYVVRVSVAGELTRSARVPDLLVARAHQGHPIAQFALRAVLASMVAGLQGR